MTARRIERLEDPETAMLSVLAGFQAGLWTAMPAVVLKVDLAKMTCEVQVTIQARLRNPDQSHYWVTLPPLVDCPLIFPSGGGFTLTFPVKAGDECLVVFASRCIDTWWQSGGTGVQADFRMHDLSDGFVLVGPRSQPRVLTGVSSSDVVLRNDENTSRVSIAPGGAIALTSPVSVSITAPAVNITGNVSTTGTLKNNGVNVGSSHVHGGVQTGGSNTGGPA